MNGVVIRIALRYLAGVLIAHGLLAPEDRSLLSSDPDLVMMIETGVGFVVGAVAEGYYAIAKRFGWKT